jgi:rubrerythrin
MQALRANRLQFDPSMVVRSVPELFGLAQTLSAQAIERYQELGARMADLGNEHARAAFSAIEAEQRRHAQMLEHRMAPDLKGPPGPVRRWTDLAIFDDEELSGTRLATPYRVLSVAVRNGERAFSFWTYISAHSEDPEVKAEAERLARDELAHLRELRAARRRAYHQGRQRETGDAGRLRSLSPGQFLAEAARTEASLAAVHGAIAGRLRALGHPQAEAIARISDEEAAAARAIATDTPLARGVSVEADLPDEAEAMLNLAIERLEGAVEGYLVVAETSQHEDVVAEAQRLAEAAVRRLAAAGR